MADTRTNDIIEAVIDLEKRFAALRTLIGIAKEEKPKKARAENPWFTFNKRVDSLMTENKTRFNGIGEAKKFAAHLKAANGYEWADADILQERQAWDRAHPASCVQCHENPTGHLDEHRDCIIGYTRAIIESGKKVADPVKSWMRASGMKMKVVEKEKEEAAKPAAKPVADIDTKALLEEIESLISS
jgi:hypothetical protein